MATIIVCIDMNSASENALGYACHLIKKNNNNLKLHILTVIEGSHRNLLFGSEMIGSQKHLQMDKYLKKIIDNICKKHDITPVVSIREGDIISEITNEVKTIVDCKMIIFGKSQKSKSDNTVLPKIVGRIGDKINAPVFIIPENIGENDWQNLI
jgi:nucleotide-binding universal stress UspA family protein